MTDRNRLLTVIAILTLLICLCCFLIGFYLGRARGMDEGYNYSQSTMGCK